MALPTPTGVNANDASGMLSYINTLCKYKEILFRILDYIRLNLSKFVVKATYEYYSV